MKVLILEDEEAIRGFVRINLKRKGIEVVEAETGEEAIALIEKDSDIQIAILDVMLPTEMGGFDVCEQLRVKYPRMGIIMLTAKSQDTDKVLGLELGADDYISKPFSPVELVARINALNRRLQPVAEADEKNILEAGPFIIHLDERKLTKNGKEIDLTPTEFAIVRMFLENPNKSISRDEILDEVWGRHFIGDFKIVDVNIRRIRQKIEKNPSKPVYIETVWGYGYLWKRDKALELH
ncbi:putative transcriptional regulatory protein OmpR [Paenibacillus larvae subsp. larvae]|uniref:DNA-binding response regulator n=3 Tax=Paenibacillus larvae TaxID=1464 RepID=A0A1V0UPF2_9BACL|nr:response regulator transcription factor [Paenibacillus larvae]AHD06318.1 putative transcriptional regulatory protein OmpR [Paenibacillus larvae subsp. larvae DSM 25430]AQZ45358.1 DNA-binding response regulator [Paenibacillus larvae subsp. pulvifaciens]ARF67155.1 DNA-binding response regulator [Paenibacillus larvae subsp. pulvifaciens]AVF27312.1 putative transcriptional regulatory protein OmpR [Paenibacillus larvae subsp. larvae]AVF31975.1 putative transcriptional regulatory protein OmpR [Pa